jgi:predicted aspartyl protease
MAAAALAAAAVEQTPAGSAAPPVPPAAQVPPGTELWVPGGPTIPTATIDSSLEVHGQTLKAEEMMSRMLVRVRVNNRGPFYFIVDSGADSSVVGSTLAVKLGLPRGKPVRMQSTAGPREVDTVMLDRIALGTSEVVRLSVPALPETSLGADGVIGIDALAGQRLMLDFIHHTITVQDARIQVASSPDEIVVTARRRKGQLILTQGMIEGDQVYAVIDTGTEVTVGNMALRDRIFRGRRMPTPVPIKLISVTGQSVSADLYVVPEMHLGGLTFRQVQIAFADVPPFAFFGLMKDPAMLLGSDLLENFSRISLDFRRRRVRFLLRE